MEFHPSAANDLRRQDDAIFVGEVNANGVLTEHLRAFVVQFRPGAHTVWHTHSSDQVLIVTEGRGIVATEQEEIEVTRGDIVVAPAGEKHWHGATPTSAMTHIALLAPGEEVVFGDPRG